jgi:hypothetical protein
MKTTITLEYYSEDVKSECSTRKVIIGLQGMVNIDTLDQLHQRSRGNWQNGMQREDRLLLRQQPTEETADQDQQIQAEERGGTIREEERRRSRDPALLLLILQGNSQGSK